MKKIYFKKYDFLKKSIFTSTINLYKLLYDFEIKRNKPYFI